MNDKVKKDIIDKNIDYFYDGFNSLLQGVISNAIEEGTSPYIEANASLQQEVDKLKYRISELENERNEAYENQAFYKKKLEDAQSAPKLSEVIEKILKVITLFYQNSPKSQELSSYIDRSIRNALSPYGQIIFEQSESLYDPSRDDCMGYEPTHNYFISNKIKEVICVGFKFYEQYSEKDIKEQVILYSYTPQEPPHVAEEKEVSSQDYRLIFPLYYRINTSDNINNHEKFHLICESEAFSQRSALIDIVLKGGDSLEIATAENKKIKDVITEYQFPKDLLPGSYSFDITFIQNDQMIKPKITLYKTNDKNYVGEFIGNELPIESVFLHI